jgi:hypothetical protein
MSNNPHLVPVTSKVKNDDEGQDHFIERKICICFVFLCQSEAFSKD